MKVSYYPGCSLLGTAREYEESIRAVCNVLGIELCELEDWNCCGASSAHSTNEFLSIALPARNLVIAEKAGLDLVVPCAACYQRLKVAERKLPQEPELNMSYRGKIKVKHLLDFLCEEENLKQVKENIKKPLSGLKVVCYYGCLMVRPPRITGAVNFEDPQNMDELLKLLGAESLPWSYKTDCCGGSLALTRPDIVKRLVDKLLGMAREAGADCLATGCPMCQANLDTRQAQVSKEFGKDHHLPIFYFTELIGLALGCRVDKWVKKHLVDPRSLLTSRGLIG